MPVKILLIVCVFFSHGGTNTIKHKPIVQFPEKETEKVVKAILACGPINNIDPIIAFKEVREGTYENTREFKEYIRCAFEKSGHLRDDAGHIDAEKVVHLFPANVNMKDTIYGCSDEEGEDAAETVFKFFKCFQDKSPVHVKFM